MISNRAWNRLHGMVAQDLPSLAANTILPDGSGYWVFECYRVEPQQQLWLVTKRGTPVASMTSLKSAVSWCVADKYQQHQLSTEIQSLDNHKLLLESDIDTRRQLWRQCTGTRRDAASAKLASRQQRLDSVNQRLAKCINVAKYWQLRGFNNETARSGRNTPHRTHR